MKEINELESIKHDEKDKKDHNKKKEIKGDVGVPEEFVQMDITDSPVQKRQKVQVAYLMDKAMRLVLTSGSYKADAALKMALLLQEAGDLNKVEEYLYAAIKYAEIKIRKDEEAEETSRVKRMQERIKQQEEERRKKQKEQEEKEEEEKKEIHEPRKPIIEIVPDDGGREM